MIRKSEHHLWDQSKDTTSAANSGGMDELANMGNINLDENGNSTSGKMATGASQQAAIKLAATFNKNKGDMSPYLLALFEFNQWQAEFNERIKAIEEQIRQMRERAEQAFEDALLAEQLREAIKDGISPKEQHAIVKLLGKEAKGKDIAELDLMLQAYEGKRNSEGTQLSESADTASEKVVTLKQEMKSVLAGLPKNATEGALRNASLQLKNLTFNIGSITTALEATDQLEAEGVAGVGVVTNERRIERDVHLSNAEVEVASAEQSAFLNAFTR